MIKYLIVDDEPLAHELIENFCERLPHFSLQKNCYDALEAIEWLSSGEADLMFLDLNMPKLQGFDFLRSLNNPPKVIVTTAYKEHALEGFELAVEDYLVKPFSFERFVKAVNKATITPGTSKSVINTRKTETDFRFFVKGEEGYHQINAADILYVEASGNYAKLQLKDRNILAHEKISDLEISLHSSQFMRVHRSFIVSILKIDSIQGSDIRIGSHTVPIGQTYSKMVHSKILK